MYAAPTRCPICSSELEITRVHCSSCDTSIEGRFVGGPIAHLTAEHLDFIVTFVRCEGKINRMEQEVGLSYPTIRNRLHEVIRALGFDHLLFENERPVFLNSLAVYFIQMLRMCEIHGTLPLLWRKLT